MFDFVSALNGASALRYILWRVGGAKSPVVLRTRAGLRFELRPNGLGRGGNNDYGVAYELFVHDLYAPALRLDPGQVRLVVDCGANVGLSTLLWLKHFPRCRVLAFEPHAGHAAQAARNVALNDGQGRVELVEAGVGAANRDARLSDGGSGSTVVEGGGGIAIRIVDLPARLADMQVDLLKLDCEGGEYEVLGDARFGALDVRAIVMEWHARPGGRGRDWCVARLQELGYRVDILDDGAENGMLWAERVEAPAAVSPAVAA